MSSATKPSGRVLSATSNAKQSKVGRSPVVDLSFAADWNGLDKAERRQIRRLVRIGQPQETAEQAELAVGYAAYQRARPWYRFFWLWVVPLAIAGVLAGANLHPLVIGLVIGAVVVSMMARRNFRRVEKVNEGLLDPSM